MWLLLQESFYFIYIYISLNIDLHETLFCTSIFLSDKHSVSKNEVTRSLFIFFSSGNKHMEVSPILMTIIICNPLFITYHHWLFILNICYWFLLPWNKFGSTSRYIFRRFDLLHDTMLLLPARCFFLFFIFLMWLSAIAYPVCDGSTFIEKWQLLKFY